MTKQQLLDEIKELKECLAWYIKEDDVQEGDPHNQYWIDGKYRAMKALGIEIEE